MKRFVKNYIKYRYFLRELIKKDIKLKYRNSVLGVLWTLLEPLLTMLVLVLVFSSLLGRKTENYAVFILSGRLIYSFYSGVTKQSLKSIRSNSGMIKKVYVPKYMYPLSSAFSNYIMFALSLLVLLCVALTQKIYPTVYAFQALYPLAVLFIIGLGSGMILSVMNVFFKDVEYLWNIFLMLLMYASAIFYQAESVINETNKYIFKLNPLYCIINSFRHAVFGTAMESWDVMYSGIFSISVLLIGFIVFIKNQDKFALHL
ncbi:MAG: ABC transporter permease [Lachnospiraceae bacterium]|nr:ABC transporter permease [Lachnospiraceae bacterium]